MRVVSWLVPIALVAAGCVTGDVSEFHPQAGQEALFRDGVPAIASMRANSIVLVRQANRERQVGSRPSYVIGILNTGKEPVTFVFDQTQVAQIRDGRLVKSLETYSYEELVREEKNMQVLSALLLGVAAGANSMAAANAGTYTASGTVTGPYGTSHVSVVGYDPTAAAVASANASMQNQAMISSAVETGRRNLDVLESTIIKDSTIFPGEWYGGQLQFEQATGTPPLSFRISITVGADVHEVDVTQVKPS